MKYLLYFLPILAGCAVGEIPPSETRLYRAQLLRVVQLEQRVEALERENHELRQSFAFVGPVQQ